MAMQGVVYKDLIAPGMEEDVITSPDSPTANKRQQPNTLSDEPTASHALAMADHDTKGHAQLDSGGGEVKDLGWKQDADDIPKPLVGGMPNDELWVLIRRFNKIMYHVKVTHGPVPGNLDLNIADEEEFSPDKLRANIERLYMTVGIGMMAFVKHIVRLRSWRESRRTAVFCAAYAVAWLLDMIVPLLSVTTILLIAYPPCREVLFPPAPMALVSTRTGGVQKPKAGVLGSTDSATGAPEKHKGEAVEAEASNFVNSIASVALSSASGKHPQAQPADQSDSPSSRVPDPTSMAVSASNARVSSGGGAAGESHDKTKVPMETAMWSKMRPVMHGLADATDTWERFANALSPTPPFPHDEFRLRLAAIVVSILASSLFITNYMVVKGFTLTLGLAFFSDPLIWRGLDWLNTHYPNWQKLLELRNSILKGVPTNAQLTLTLLRIGEANKAPLPPPPSSSQPPPDESKQITDQHLRATGSDWPLNATPAELDTALHPDPSVPHSTSGADIDAAKAQDHGKKGSRLLSFFKSGVKGTVETALGADRLKAKVGSEAAKHRLGAIPTADEENLLSGPVDFKCRFHGKKGTAYISARATVPCIAFSLDKALAKTGTLDVEETDLHPVWTVPVADILELKKVGGLGWKAKLVVGWALDREVADGVEIVDVKGETWTLTAMVLRDEMFNRLVAMGGQKWESW
ncbi:hypothetical protein LTR08_002955 [Meristemomyces frigidus]|nr:hypothetical protein LTR08_002955 [Meristemomyces frigidus]